MKKELAALLARHPDVIETNTPLDVLAGYMLDSLKVFERSLIERADHHFYHPERSNEIIK